jgi:Pyruvate/2-oxoacid:ferredoxin oxidoreductase delta subunit
MAIRKIVKIDENKCSGCGLCIPNCAEGALQIIDGKAKLVKDIYCDGLGACLGHCPMDAISITERDAEEFDEKATHEYLNKKPVKAFSKGCPGSRAMMFKNTTNNEVQTEGENQPKVNSKLSQWPVQLMLVPVSAPYFKEADLLVTADCVPFAYGNYHNDFLKDRALVVGCPKLDDNKYYTEKLEEIIKINNLKSITVLRMEVPCCGGMAMAVKSAREKSGVNIPIEIITIGIQGNIISRNTI